MEVLCSNVFARVSKNPGEIFKIIDDFSVLSDTSVSPNPSTKYDTTVLTHGFIMMKKLIEMLPLLRLWRLRMELNLKLKWTR